jgi:hypothetical protein
MFRPRVLTPGEPTPLDPAQREEFIKFMEIGEQQVRAKRERREAALAGMEGTLCDTEAALECACSYHDAKTSLHDGGINYPCQKTQEERAAALDEALRALSAWHNDPEYVARRAAAEAELSAAAAELGVVVDRHGGGAPYVIEGSVDKQHFYLRERSDWWTMEIENLAEGEPWRYDTASILVAEGSSDTFTNAGKHYETVALQIAVKAVRTFLARRTCAHPGESAWYATYGVKRSEAELWRVYIA